MGEMLGALGVIAHSLDAAGGADLKLWLFEVVLVSQIKFFFHLIIIEKDWMASSHNNILVSPDLVLAGV